MAVTVVTNPAKPKVTVISSSTPVGTVSVTAGGRVGPKGEKGEKGETGQPGTSGAGYDYTQSSPLETWTIAHNLGYRPSVSVSSVGGVEIVASVIHLSLDVMQLSFNTPVAGSARLS